jgi:hypothetical protein
MIKFSTTLQRVRSENHPTLKKLVMISNNMSAIKKITKTDEKTTDEVSAPEVSILTKWPTLTKCPLTKSLSAEKHFATFFFRFWDFNKKNFSQVFFK